MNRLLASCLALIVAASTLLGLAACAGDGPAKKPTVVATIFAYYDIIRSVGDGYIQPVILLPPRTSPHDYSPTISDKRAVQNASLVVKNGLGLDHWVDRMVATNQQAHVLTIADAIHVTPLHTEEWTGAEGEAATEAGPGTAPAPATEHAEHAGHGPHADVGNPHIWLDPQNQIAATQAITEALCKMDPLHAQNFRANAEKYIDQVGQLDAEFKAAAAKFTHKDFIGFHSAYDYLAHRYGLRQVASLEQVEEAGMTVGQARQIIALIKQDHMKAIFVENALPSKDADMIVRETGVKKLVLQPIETYSSLSDTYVGLMQENLKSLKEALQ